MTWLGQVVHVMMKDFRQNRSIFLLYAIVVAGAARISMSDANGSWSDMPTSLFVMLLGSVIAASLVLADSPSRADAFWVSRPLHPAAVLGAKLLGVALLIVGVGLVGQLAAIIALGFDARTATGMLLDGAMSYSIWLLAAMVIAAQVRNLQRFLLALLVYLFASSLVSGFVYRWSSDVPALWAATTWEVCWAGLVVALLAASYRARDNGRRILRLSVALALALAVAPLVLPADRSARPRSPGRRSC